MTLEQRAAAAAAEAKRAEEAGDRWAAHDAWRRYQRIVDAARPPGELVGASEPAAATRRQRAGARQTHAVIDAPFEVGRMLGRLNGPSFP